MKQHHLVNAATINVILSTECATASPHLNQVRSILSHTYCRTTYLCVWEIYAICHWGLVIYICNFIHAAQCTCIYLWLCRWNICDTNSCDLITTCIICINKTRAWISVYTVTRCYSITKVVLAILLPRMYLLFYYQGCEPLLTMSTTNTQYYLALR